MHCRVESSDLYLSRECFFDQALKLIKPTSQWVLNTLLVTKGNALAKYGPLLKEGQDRYAGQTWPNGQPKAATDVDYSAKELEALWDTSQLMDDVDMAAETGVYKGPCKMFSPSEVEVLRPEPGTYTLSVQIETLRCTGLTEHFDAKDLNCHYNKKESIVDIANHGRNRKAKNVEKLPKIRMGVLNLTQGQLWELCPSLKTG